MKARTNREVVVRTHSPWHFVQEASSEGAAARRGRRAAPGVRDASNEATSRVPPAASPTTSSRPGSDSFFTKGVVRNRSTVPLNNSGSSNGTRCVLPGKIASCAFGRWV